MEISISYANLNTESKYNKYIVNKRLRQDAGFNVVTYVPERTHAILLIMHHKTPSVKDNHKWTYMLSLTHNLDTYIFNQAKLSSVRILENPMRYLVQSAQPELKVMTYAVTHDLIVHSFSTCSI